MAQAAVSLVIAQLADLLFEEAELLSGVEEQAEWIETELRLMLGFLEYLGGLEDLDKHETVLFQDITDIAGGAEDVVETLSVKSKQRRKWGAFRRHVSVVDFLIHRHIMGTKMERIRRKISDVSQKMEMYDVLNVDGQWALNPSSSAQQHEQIIILKYAESEAVQGQAEINEGHTSGPAGSSDLSNLVNALDALLCPGFLLHKGIQNEAKSLKQDFESLQSVWDEIVVKLVEQDERWKAWIQDLRDIICYAQGVIGSFVSSREQQKSCTHVQRLFWLRDERKLEKEISKVKFQIKEAFQRKQYYGIGAIKARNSSSSMVTDLKWRSLPKDSTPPSTSFKAISLSIAITALAFLARLAVSIPTLVAVSLGAPVVAPVFLSRRGRIGARDAAYVLDNLGEQAESLSRDLRLMHALLKDIEATENLDTILSAWVREMKSLANDAEAIISSYIKMPKEVFSIPSMIDEAKNVQVGMQSLKEKIRDASETRIVQRRIKTAYMIRRMQSFTVGASNSNVMGFDGSTRRRTKALPSGDQVEVADPEDDGHKASKAFSTLNERLANLLDPKCLSNSKLTKKVERFKKECVIFLSFWKEIELVEPDERLKVWMEDMRDAACYADEIFKSFMAVQRVKRSSQQGKNKVVFGFIAQRNLLREIGKIEDKLKEAFNRKRTYGIGEFRGRNSSNSMVPVLKWHPPTKAPTNFNSLRSYSVPIFFPCPSPGSSIIGKIVEEQTKLKHIDDEVEWLCRELRLMHALFEDVKAEPVDYNSTVWVEELQAVAREAEAVIDSYSLIAAKTLKIIQFPKLSKIAKEIARIKAKIQNISTKRKLYGIERYKRRIHSNSLIQEVRISRQESLELKDAEVFGIDERENTLKALLLSDDESRSVISITGTRGIGKTTLAKHIYHDHDIIRKFTLRAWVSIEGLKQVSASAGVENIMLQIRRFLEARGKLNGEEDPVQTLEKIIASNGAYLIVFDDIQFPQLWHGLIEALPNDTENGSRLVVTTCQSSVSSLADHIYDLTTLSNGDSSKLFAKTLKKDIPRDLQALVDQILFECQGLPGAITTMGNLLSNRILSQKLCSRVLEQLQQGQRPWQPSLDTINKSLPSNLRRCFRYFSLFPLNYDIPARRLITLWISEGLVHQRRDVKRSPEETAGEYLKDLIDRNMVQAKRKLNGKVKTCQLAEHLREFWIPETKRIIFFPGDDKARSISSSVFFPGDDKARSISSSSSAGMHYLADCDDKDSFSSYIHGREEDSSSSLRTHFKDTLCFLSFDKQEGSKPGEDIGSFLSRCIRTRCFQRLRILDLERVFRPNLPKELGKLSSLRYLGLRWTYLERLPSSISKLLKLQTLDLKHTYISILPGSIWNMLQLRHLYLSESYRSRFPPRHSGGSLDDLQTLWGVFVDEDSPIENGLDRVTNLKKLGVACRLMLSDKVRMLSQLEALGAWLEKLKDLQSLRLRSYDEQGLPWFLPSKDLSILSNLSSLYLSGILTNQSVVSKFPPGLTELTLSFTRLESGSDPMHALQYLEGLKMLRLFSNSYIGKKMRCSREGFLQLEVLRIWKLEQLEEWEVEAGALPKLRDLEVRSCTELKMLPAELLHVSTLDILLSNMPEQFTAQYIDEGRDAIIVDHSCTIKKDDDW